MMNCSTHLVQTDHNVYGAVAKYSIAACPLKPCMTACLGSECTDRRADREHLGVYLIVSLYKSLNEGCRRGSI